jgi:hypothetical protein
MMQPFPNRMLVLSIGFSLPLLAAVGGDAENGPQPRRITLARSSIPLSEAMKQFRAQSGNILADRRLAKTDPKLTLALESTTFWRALEEIARQADVRISLYQQDGAIALVDGPYRAMALSYHGLFRTAVKRLTLSRDLDAGNHSCVVHLETAWEPWFQPFYVSTGPSRARFAKDGNGQALEVKIPERGQVGVAGRAAVEIELRMPAPRRSCAHIEKLDGKLNVIGAGKMLTFTFSSLRPIKRAADALRQGQEGISVNLTRITVQPERWTFDVVIQNPPGGPQFESYQSWIDNNRIHLEKGQGGDRQVFLPQAADEEQLENVTATRAVIRYHFTNRSRTQAPPGKLEDWRLVYRTPGRIVELTVPFSFKDLLLP